MDTAGRGIHKAFQPRVYAASGPAVPTDARTRKAAAVHLDRQTVFLNEGSTSSMQHPLNSCAQLARRLGVGLLVASLAVAPVAGADAAKQGAARAQLTVRVTHLSNDRAGSRSRCLRHQTIFPSKSVPFWAES